jgi:hypothetical protein
VAGELRVRDLVITGAFDRKSTALARVSVTGVIDARDAAPLAHTTATALCAQAAAAGVACTPCRDQVRTCVTVEYRGLSAEAVTLTTEL